MCDPSGRLPLQHGHSPVFDSGRPEVAEVTLALIKEHPLNHASPAPEPDRPETLAARLKSIRLRYESGDGDQVAELTLPLVTHYTKAMGSGHRDTFQARLLHAQCAAYRYRVIERSYDKDGAPVVDTAGVHTMNQLWDMLVPDCESTLGADDPDTLAIREARTAEYCELGLHEHEPAGFAALAAARSRILGPKHSDTFETLIQQAASLRECEIIEDSRKLCAEAAAGLEHTLGPDHPRTRDALEQLESWETWPDGPAAGPVAPSST